MVYNIFTDGASRGNPGKSGVGVVIFDGKEKVDELFEFTGIKTNNEAEYLALILGVNYLIRKGQKTANFFLDSEFVVKQLKGEYKVKSDKIKLLFDEVQALITGLGVNFFWVPRSENKLADELANRAIDEKGRCGNGFEKPSNLLFEKAFFGKINCLKLQLSKTQDIYFHLGFLKGDVWDWKKVKMSDVEVGEIVYLLKRDEGKCAFYHKFADGKTQIWCSRHENGFNIKIDDVSKNLSIGEMEVFRILLEECIRKGIN